MKKLLSLIIVLSMLFTLCACSAVEGNESGNSEVSSSGADTSGAEETDDSISGTVTKIDGNTVTIQTEDGNELSFTVNDSTVYSMDMGQMPSDMGEMPDGMGQPADGETPPEKPSGDNMSQNGESNGQPPEMPQGGMQGNMQGNGGGANPPEMPSGELPDGNQSFGGQQPPEKPSGDSDLESGATQEKPSEDMSGNQSGQNIPGDNGFQPSLEMLSEGTQIKVTLNSDGSAAELAITISGGFGGGMPGEISSQQSISYTAVNTCSENKSFIGKEISSTGTDENAILVTGGDVTIKQTEIQRISDDSTGGDNASFYGVGAAVLATGGTVTLSESNITTDSAGGAGVFAYGEGTAYVSDCTISTLQNTSGGIHVAGGGTLYATDLLVETYGESSAAIRSDRGSGTMVVDGGYYTSNGIGSPAIYSTADITVSNAKLQATGSEAICLEGKNSIRLTDCTLTGNMSDDSRNDCTWNVILYQSMSGDAAEGTAVFEMNGGTLTAENGGMFYTTNTSSSFVLTNVDVVVPADCEFFLKCTGNSNQRGWGTSGSNGAQCTFSAIDQSMSGNIIWDSISTLDFNMTEGSVLIGAFINDESNAGTGGKGYACLTLGEGCTWVVTDNSTLTALNCYGTIRDENGLAVTIVGTDGTVYVSGTSAFTITVESYGC